MLSPLVDKEHQREAEGQKARSLRQLIEDMEDEVLANADVDVFEEVFKLIFAKLYDEIACYQGRHGQKFLRLRNTNTAAQLKANIQALLQELSVRNTVPSNTKYGLHLRYFPGAFV